MGGHEGKWLRPKVLQSVPLGYRSRMASLSPPPAGRGFFMPKSPRVRRFGSMVGGGLKAGNRLGAIVGGRTTADHAG